MGILSDLIFALKYPLFALSDFYDAHIIFFGAHKNVFFALYDRYAAHKNFNITHTDFNGTYMA